MQLCRVCRVDLPAYAGAGRPRTYCTECVDLKLRESDHRARYGRRPDRRYTVKIPESASVITADMSDTAVAWRLERLARLAAVRDYDIALAARKRERGIPI